MATDTPHTAAVESAWRIAPGRPRSARTASTTQAVASTKILLRESQGAIAPATSAPAGTRSSSRRNARSKSSSRSTATSSSTEYCFTAFE